MIPRQTESPPMVNGQFANDQFKINQDLINTLIAECLKKHTDCQQTINEQLINEKDAVKQIRYQKLQQELTILLFTLNQLAINMIEVNEMHLLKLQSEQETTEAHSPEETTSEPYYLFGYPFTRKETNGQIFWSSPRELHSFIFDLNNKFYSLYDIFYVPSALHKKPIFSYHGKFIYVSAENFQVAQALQQYESQSPLAAYSQTCSIFSFMFKQIRHSNIWVCHYSDPDFIAKINTKLERFLEEVLKRNPSIDPFLAQTLYHLKQPIISAYGLSIGRIHNLHVELLLQLKENLPQEEANFNGVDFITLSANASSAHLPQNLHCATLTEAAKQEESAPWQNQPNLTPFLQNTPIESQDLFGYPFTPGVENGQIIWCLTKMKCIETTSLNSKFWSLFQLFYDQNFHYEQKENVFFRTSQIIYISDENFQKAQALQRYASNDPLAAYSRTCTIFSAVFKQIKDSVIWICHDGSYYLCERWNNKFHEIIKRSCQRNPDLDLPRMQTVPQPFSNIYSHSITRIHDQHVNLLLQLHQYLQQKLEINRGLLGFITTQEKARAAPLPLNHSGHFNHLNTPEQTKFNQLLSQFLETKTCCLSHSIFATPTSPPPLPPGSLAIATEPEIQSDDLLEDYLQFEELPGNSSQFEEPPEDYFSFKSP